LATAARRHDCRTATTGTRYEIPAAAGTYGKIPAAGWCATRHRAADATAATADATATASATGRGAHATTATWRSTASSPVATALRAGRCRNCGRSDRYRRTD